MYPSIKGPGVGLGLWATALSIQINTRAKMSACLIINMIILRVASESREMRHAE